MAQSRLTAGDFTKLNIGKIHQYFATTLVDFALCSLADANRR
jgi:hypothetical protein